MRMTRLVATVATLGLVLGGGIATVVGAASATAAPLSVSITPNGAPATLTFSAPGATATAKVMVLHGQKLRVKTTAGTFADNCDVQMSVLRPNGTLLSGPVCAGRRGASNAGVIRRTGLYSVRLTAGASATGTLKVAAKSASGPASITPGAKAITVTTSGGVEDIRLGFSVRANTSYSVNATDGSLAACDAALAFVDGSGSHVGSGLGCAGNGGFLDTTPFPSGGTFFVRLLTNAGAAPGAIHLALYKVTDRTGTIEPNGPAVGVHTGVPGQNVGLTFSATAATSVSVELSDSTYAGCFGVRVALVRPDGSQVGGVATCNGTEAFLDAVTLDQSGTWAVLVDPVYAAKGAATVQLFEVVDHTHAIKRNGTPIAVTTTRPGENAHLTFSGSAGAQFSVALSDSTYAGCFGVGVALLRPDGSQIAGASTCNGADAFVDTVTLDASGAWSVLVDPVGTNTGSATVRLFKVTDPTRAITVGGARKTFSSKVPGENAHYTFSGSAGDQRTVEISASTFPGCFSLGLALVRPDGSTLSSRAFCGADGTLGPATLDATGTWTVLVDPVGAGTGKAKVELN